MKEMLKNNPEEGCFLLNVIRKIRDLRIRQTLTKRTMTEIVRPTFFI